MTPQEDPFWQELVDLEDPSAAEMATAEAELRSLEPQPALPRREIDALVARGTGRPSATSHRITLQAPPASRPRRRFVLAGVVLALSMTSVAALAVLWPEGRNSVSELDLPTALAMINDPKQSDERLVSAIVRIDERCSYAMEALSRIALEGTEPILVDEAKRGRWELIDLLTNGTGRRPEPVDDLVVGMVQTALDQSVPLDQRHEALLYLRNVARQGIVGILAARLSGTEEESSRQFILARMLKELR